MERFKSINDIFSEATKAAGRFRSPLSYHEKTLLGVGRILSKALQKLTGDLFIKETGDPIPAQWKALLGYLYKEGLLKRPGARFAVFTEREPYIPRVHLAPASVAGLTDGSDSVESFSGGSSPDTEEALSKAVGELLERYPLLLYRNKNLIHKSIADLKKDNIAYIDPYHITQFDEEQKRRFMNRNFSDTDIFKWVKGFSATRNQDVLIPAQLVFWNYRTNSEPVLRQPTTNGMGGFFTLEEAVLSGFYELLHRDGFLLHWLTNTPPPQIQIESIADGGVQEMAHECRNKNLELYIFDVTTDIPAPSIACAIIDRNGPAISVGGGGGHNPITAIRQAISETTAVYHWLTGQDASYELPRTYDPFFTRLTQKERALLWKNKAMLPHFEFFLKGKKRLMSDSFAFLANIPNEPVRRLEFYTEILKKRGAGYELAWYKAKHRVLDTLGYHSVQVILPALLPLYLTETYAPLNAPRLNTFRKILSPQKNDSLNAIPQPFT